MILIDSTDSAGVEHVPPLVMLQAYQALIARHPEQADLKEDYDALLDRLAAGKPANALVLSALARRELQKGSAQAYQSAAEDLAGALRAGSKSPEDYMLLAELLYRSGGRSEAAEILKHVIAIFPYIPTPYENLSICYLAMGELDQAKEAVTEGLRRFPEDSNLRMVQQRLVDGMNTRRK